MAQKVGTLELKTKEVEGKTIEAYMGSVNVAGVIAGGIAIAENPNLQPNAKMTHIVKVRSAGEWATVGKARFLRKNAKSSHYMEMVLESPIIDAKIGRELWLRAFASAGDNTGPKPDAEEYDIIWGNGRRQAATSDVLEGDEIPFG